MEIRGFPRQGPRLSVVHGASTANATVVAMVRAAVLSVATSLVPTMATHGSTTATATAYSVATSTSIAAVIHGNQRQMPRHSTSIATVILPRQVPWVYVEIDTELHSCCNANFHRRQTTATSMAFRGHPRQLPRKFSNTRQLSRTSTAIATDGISANVSADVAAGFHGRIRR